MFEIFDDFVWTKQKKIITRNKHGIPGLGNFSYFNTNSASPPSPMHYHSDIIEIHCIVKGNHYTHIEKGGSITAYALTGNQVFFTFPFELHSNGNQPLAPCEFYAFQIATDDPSHILGLDIVYSRKLVRLLKQLPNRHMLLDPMSIGLVRSAFALFSQFTPDSFMTGSQFLSCFLFNIQSLEPVSDILVRYPDNRIKKAIDYLNFNIQESLRLVDLADAAGYSLSHFKTKFRDEIGITPRSTSSCRKSIWQRKC